MSDHSDVLPGALRSTWVDALAGDPELLDRVAITGPRHVLASPFAVTDAAAAVVACATLASAEHRAAIDGRPVAPVAVDRLHAGIAMVSEGVVRIDGEQPSVWDPLAGDYRGSDGWIRLHTNYQWHRAAALRALECEPTRDAVMAAVAARAVVELETAVVAEHGVAAAMRDRVTWESHPQGQAVGAMPLVGIETFGAARSRHTASAGRVTAPPLTGIRVLDLTRVIAGPLASKVMAAHGAEVLRVDPPGFEEVPLLVADTTVGKRAAALDLRVAADRDALLRLVADADVVVHGYRPGALTALGLGDDVLADASPGLVVGRISAWGRSGPWQQRRGFDSLVQMASGIAEEGMQTYGAAGPRPLPCQFLDHGSGWLLAAGLIRALTMRESDGSGRRVTVTLARTGRWLQELPRVDAMDAPRPDDAVIDRFAEEHRSALGLVRLARLPGTIGEDAPGWDVPPTPLGAHRAEWGRQRRTSGLR